MARYLSRFDNRKVILDISNIDSLQFGGKSTIEDFLLSTDISILKYGKLFKIINNYVKKHLKNINRINQRLILVLDEVSMNLKKSDIDDLLYINKAKFIYAFGFYQNFMYWTGPYLYELKNPSKDYRDLNKLIVEEDPIIIHYRMGTVGTVWEYQWGILSPKFFEAALSALEESLSTTKKTIWIFSDNFPEAKKVLKQNDLIKKYKIFFVNDSRMSPAELLMLLSKSNYLVCSNSTFSLTAAKIGGVGNVIVPSEFSKHASIEFCMPNNWIKVKSIWLENN